MWWNREFMASLTKDQVIGLLKHECLHLVFEHTTERKRTPHMIWNYATDLAINSTIPSSQLPDCGLIPGKSLPPLEDTSNLSPQDIQRYNAISDLIESLPTDKTSEFYFDKLMQSEEIKELAEGAASFEIGELDSHEGWDSISDESMSDQLKEKIKDIIAQAAQESEDKHWGTVSASIKKKVMTSISKEVNWESILRRFCGFSNRADRTSSIHRLNRKYPNIHPGVKKNYKPRINVYLDESGSVNDDALGVFFGELRNLSNHVDFTLYKFDTSVDVKNKIDFKGKKRVSLNRSLIGGTCFKAPTEHALNDKPDGYIIMTDGCAPKPPPSRIKRAWVLVSGCKLFFDKDNNDIEINLK
jgi:predicted metal-dependent peptidase